MLIVLFIILLLFGGSKLPSLARGLGLSIKEFKKAAQDETRRSPQRPSPAKSVETKKPGNDAPTHGAN